MRNVLWLGLMLGCDATADIASRTEAAEPSLPPILHDEAFHSAPVRGDPGDVLLLPGDRLRADAVVVYQEATDVGPLSPPAGIPTSNTSVSGTVPIVSALDAPSSLVVKLPAEMISGTTYALWVVTAAGWSNGVRINDARPLWITPPFVYDSDVPWRAREIKIVGRNLNGAPGEATRVIVRAGPIVHELPVVTDRELERHVIRATIPPSLPPGMYGLMVTRGAATGWVAVADQRLEVRPTPPEPPVFPVESRGCRPDDTASDTACVLAAIADAAAAGGGVVEFGPGRWRLTSASVPDREHGIIVPRNVSLRGHGASATTVQRAALWRSWAVFTLEGSNQISDIRFDVERLTAPPRGAGHTFFMLGRRPWLGASGTVDDVVFHDNTFSWPHYAILAGFLPIRRLTIVRNDFGAFQDAIYLTGNPTPGVVHFRVEDSVIAQNTFKPGAAYYPAIGQGTIASEIGASLRLDFSDNVADGHATDYLEGSPPGWRAAYFFHMDNNHERLLVSRNFASCTGDKGGDGEFIAFDAHRNSFAFEDVQTVVSATPGGITVGARPDTSISSTYYDDHWVQIVRGRGRGQTRQIVGYEYDDAHSTFFVTPDWDVVPDASSGMLVSRQYWQAYLLDNEVDIRGCVKPRKDPTRQVSRHGVTLLCGPSVDSVVEGNTQYESDGVLLNSRYFLSLPEPGWPESHVVQYFVDVRDNTIDGESDYDYVCSRGGIQLWHLATPDVPLPMVPAYGVSVAYNRITRADATFGGAISFEDGWYHTSAGTYWESTLVFGNTIAGVDGELPETDPAFNCTYTPRPRIGIHVLDEHTARTVIADNVVGASEPIVDFGLDTVCLEGTACGP